MREGKWVDVTTYKRGDRERKPTSWSFQIDPLARVVVTCGHLYYPDEWVTHFYPMYEKRRLNMPSDKFTAEQAQEKALAMAEGALTGLLTKLKSHQQELA